MTGSMTLLDELQRRGFTPDEDGEPWFDLPVGTDRKVRAELDDTEVRVHVLGAAGGSFWSVTCSDNNPLNVVTAVIDLAIAHAYTAS